MLLYEGQHAVAMRGLYRHGPGPGPSAYLGAAMGLFLLLFLLLFLRLFLRLFLLLSQPPELPPPPLRRHPRVGLGELTGLGSREVGGVGWGKPTHIGVRGRRMA